MIITMNNNHNYNLRVRPLDGLLRHELLRTRFRLAFPARARERGGGERDGAERERERKGEREREKERREGGREGRRADGREGEEIRPGV